MKKNNRMTLDEMLRPHKWECGKCGGELIMYPKNGVGADAGIGFCATCSPAWLESFATFCMNEEREKYNLKPVSLADIGKH